MMGRGNHTRSSDAKERDGSYPRSREREELRGGASLLWQGIIVVVGLTLTSLQSDIQGHPSLQTNQPSSVVDKARERAYAREQFGRHFKSIQVRSQRLLRLHEEGSLSAKQLTEEAREIHKSARTLRQLIALGSLATKVEQRAHFASPEEYGEGIRKLANLVWEFAHNPVHQNGKVFNTQQAAEAQTDLLSIIELSRALQRKGGGYPPPPVPSPVAPASPAAPNEPPPVPREVR
jgi:hypothetical protein